MRYNPILRACAKFLIAPIMLFALYVQFHGDYGPGGGFQAGVIFAVAFILYSLIYGVHNARKVAPMWLLRLLMAGGVLLYGGVGVLTMLLGGVFLDYDQLAHDPQDGQHYGILLVEAGVGLTVASVMMVLFFTFAGRKE